MDISNLIPFYRELLVRPISATSSSVSRCVLKSFFVRLAKSLELTSLRLFLFNDKSVAITHLYGDRVKWTNFNISGLRKERTKFNKLFFVKIRHIKANGRFVLLGYLGFTTDEYVSKSILDALDVLCLLYGNFIVKKVVQGQNELINTYLPKLYKLLSSNELPGTVILECLGIFQKLTKAYKCVYLTVNSCNMCVEYIAARRKSICLRKTKRLTVSKTFIDTLVTSKNFERFQVVELPMQIQNVLCYNETQNIENFFCDIYPIFVDAELVGVWLFDYAQDMPYDYYEIDRVINNIYNFNEKNYRFLFQRRFKKMIVNPIFQNRETRVNPNDVFVIMPFTEQWSKDVWEQAISVAVKEMGMNPVRADNLYGPNIMEDIWTGILQSSMVICDTTNRNPNVFYELGIAHTLGKKIILLTQNVDDIPFDLQAYRHVVYETTMSGGSKLRDDIKKYISEFKK